MKFKAVKCRSGIIGKSCRLRDIYRDFDEFEYCSRHYNLHVRLGYKSAKTAWRYNPLIEFSVNPSDYRKVRKVRVRKS